MPPQHWLERKSTGLGEREPQQEIQLHCVDLLLHQQHLRKYIMWFFSSAHKLMRAYTEIKQKLLSYICTAIKPIKLVQPFQLC